MLHSWVSTVSPGRREAAAFSLVVSADLSRSRISSGPWVYAYGVVRGWVHVDSPLIRLLLGSIFSGRVSLVGVGLSCNFGGYQYRAADDACPPTSVQVSATQRKLPINLDSNYPFYIRHSHPLSALPFSQPVLLPKPPFIISLRLSTDMAALQPSWYLPVVRPLVNVVANFSIPEHRQNRHAPLASANC